MKLTLIVPTLNQSECIGACLKSIRREFLGELYVVDGGSTDDTVERALEFGARVWHISASLPERIAYGGQRASGEVLFFVPPDTLLPEGWRDAIEEALRDESVMGGCFRLEMFSRGIFRMALNLCVNLLSRLENRAVFAQGLFLRSSAFTLFNPEKVSPRLCEFKVLNLAVNSSQPESLVTGLKRVFTFLRFPAS